MSKQTNKPIIKLSPQQVLRQIFSNSQILSNQQNTPPPSQLNNNTPPGPEKTCGLFDIDFIKNMPNLDTENVRFDQNKEFEECQPLTDFLIENFGNQMLELPEHSQDQFMNDSFTNENNKPMKEKSKFAKKLDEANLKIQINKPLNKNQNEFNTPNVLNDDFSSLITPNMEKQFTQLLQSIPTGDIFNMQMESDPLTIFDDMSMEETKADQEMKINQLEQPVSSVPIDHAYIKQIEFNLNDDLTNDSFSSTMTDSTQLPTSNSGIKKKRPRGVYRKDDIRNDEDYENYILRRKKNNQSSKISRANKKAAYQEIDSKIDLLANSNIKLSSKITKLEQINKLIKDMLVEKLAKSSNT